MRGITKRWLINTFGIILVILFVLIIAFAFVIQNSYYSGIFQVLNGRSSELANIFSDSSEFIQTARVYVENFPDKELMELMVINEDGQVIITSTGFAPDNNQTMPDYQSALSSDEHYADWHGNLSSGENVMALTRVMYDKDDKQGVSDRIARTVPDICIQYIFSAFYRATCSGDKRNGKEDRSGRF